MSQAAIKQRSHKEFLEYYGEIEPNFPDMILNNKTILGIDTNNNGIRDDIDVWINRTALDLNETKAMRQFARAQQKWLKLCEDKDLNEFHKTHIELKRSEKCLSVMSDYKRKVSNFSRDKLNLLSFNTEARKNCNESNHLNEKILINESISDSVTYHCDFEIQYLKNVTFGNDEWKRNSTKEKSYFNFLD